jgi:hypothetical protein
MTPFTFSRLFVLVALVVFVLAAFGVSLGSIGLVPLGLALYMVSHLVP